MDWENHRLEVVRRYDKPVHVAFWGLQHPACLWRTGEVHPLHEQGTPYRDIPSPRGHPYANDKADFALMRKIGFIYIISPNYPRCRGPPPFHLREPPKQMKWRAVKWQRK